MIPHEQIINQYCREVKKHLVCNRQTKNDLIMGLKGELLETVTDIHSLAQIGEIYGSPEAIADSLQDAVNSKEYYQARRNKKIQMVGICLITLVILIGFVMGFIHWLSASSLTYYSEEVHYESSQH